MGLMKRVFKWVAIGLPIALAAIQFVPVHRTNPPGETTLPAPPHVDAVLRRACFDCHSNETVWPWYSRVAPVSWLVTHDVNHARGHMNLSTWNRLTPEKQKRTLHEIWEQVEAGDMPLWYYLPLHPSARLSERDKAVIKAWVEQSGAAEATGPPEHGHGKH